MQLQRQLNPETRVLDERRGVVQYIASDETLDCYREVIRVKGWRFNHFKKNAPFVDSHNYESLDKLVGKVVDFGVRDGRLVETVQWAVGIGNNLADLGFEMVKAGFLKAVSVGFYPMKTLRPADGTPYQEELARLSLPAGMEPRAIYTEQEQIELSAVIIGANPNALAKAHSAGVISAAELRFIRSGAACPARSSRSSSPAARLMQESANRVPFPEVDTPADISRRARQLAQIAGLPFPESVS